MATMSECKRAYEMLVWANKLVDSGFNIAKDARSDFIAARFTPVRQAIEAQMEVLRVNMDAMDDARNEL